MLGRPLTDFENMQGFFQHLHVPKMPRTHWSVNAGWEMVESMFHIVKLKTGETTFHACFILASVDEVTMIDTTSWISIHLYVVQDWE